jgi:methionyl-tRNA synthetase
MPDYSAEQLGVDHQLIMAQVGNLLNRVMSPALLKKMQGEIGQEHPRPHLDTRLANVRDDVERWMEDFQVTKACEEVIELLMAVSGFGFARG